MNTPMRPSRLTWRRFMAVTAICAAPTLLTIAALPIYGAAMDDAAIVPPLLVAFYVTPGLSLLIAAGGLVGAWLDKDASRRAAWRANAAAGASAFGTFCVALGALFTMLSVANR